MATLQVKGMDDNLYEALKSRARREHRSLSQEVVSMIERCLTRPAGQSAANATDEFLALAGTWEDARDAKTIVRDLRKARRTNRRFSREPF